MNSFLILMRMFSEMFHQDKPTSEDYSEQKIKIRKKKIRDILDKRFRTRIGSRS